MRKLLLVSAIAFVPVIAFAQQGPSTQTTEQQLNSGIGSVSSMLTMWKSAIVSQEAQIADLQKQVADLKAQLAKASAPPPAAAKP